MNRVRSLAAIKTSLANGGVTSRELVEASLAAATDPSGEGSRTFTRMYVGSAGQVAETIDKKHRFDRSEQPLLGLPISVKDLFDVAGEPTPAGSLVLADAPPARKDAEAIQRLRVAGAVLVGRTNMTEFAFSGLGINPHYGTPHNPFDRANGRIPGGSSSGAAISVTDGMAAAAVGSDTGGSLRIPAALCGLTGFKPTAHRVPLDGAFPLSSSLDSVGSIAPTVACCALMDAVLSGESSDRLAEYDVANLRVGVLQGYVLEGLDAHVASRFQAALSILADAGISLKDFHFNALAEIPACNSKGGFAAYESYAWHHELIARRGELYDPRILSRIRRGQNISQNDYVEIGKARSRIISEAARAFEDIDVWLLPTVPVIAPMISELDSDESYFEANAKMLRNPSILNFLDGCALTIPCHLPGEAPVGLMIGALADHDQKVLGIGLAIERALAEAGCAIPAHVP